MGDIGGSDRWCVCAWVGVSGKEKKVKGRVVGKIGKDKGGVGRSESCVNIE